MNTKPLLSSKGTIIKGPLIIQPRIYPDQRGWFIESWNQRQFDNAVGRQVVFSQDNHSQSSLGVLRGLHYQLPPFTQEKLVRATSGHIFDVVVDLRHKSPTFGQWGGTDLTSENKAQLWVPTGFAHGFLAISEVTEVQYKSSGYWNKNYERAIRWDDTYLSIAWPQDRLKGSKINASTKDLEAASFQTAVNVGDVFP